MKRWTWLRWALVGVGAVYLWLPLLSTFEFSLRMRRGIYSLDAYREVLADAGFWSSMGYSLALALVAIAVGLTLVVGTAVWVHWRAPRWRGLFEFISLLPLVVPPIVLVFGYVEQFGSAAWLPLTDTPWGTDLLLCMGYVVLALPYLYRSVNNGLQAMQMRVLIEAARVCGASWPQVIAHVLLPNLRAALSAGAFLTLAIVMGEFTIASLLNRPVLGVYLQLMGANRAYEPAALAILTFGLTWAAMVVLHRVGHAQGSSNERPPH